MKLPFFDGRKTSDYELSPSKIVGVGLNYRAHIAEMGRALPDEPVIFLKPPSALLAAGEPIVLPAGFENVHFEGELAFVVGRRARKIPERDALGYVLGYTCLNDVTVRELQQKDVQWARAKGFDSFAPVGPRIVAGLDPANLELKTRVGGVEKQRSNTSDLIFSVARLLSFISGVMTLESGDLVTTGTPSGVGPLRSGDKVEVEIEGIGILANPVRADRG